jgi:hypothetical protein
MKSLPWIVVGVAVGLTAYLALNQPGPQYGTGSDDVEDAAAKRPYGVPSSESPAKGVVWLASLKRAWEELLGMMN